MYLIILLILIIFVFIIDILIKKTNGYKNFYLPIRNMQIKPKNRKFRIAVFGSTFSYYALNFDSYEGHNFSVEPQSIYYLQRTIKHFINNIESNGRVIISLTGCIFASKNLRQEDKCTTYYSFLKPKEFYRFSLVTKLKYILNRYFPFTNPKMVKYLYQDIQDYYSISAGISVEKAKILSYRRINGWQKVLGVSNIYDFKVDDSLNNTMKSTTAVLKDTIEFIKIKGLHPVLVILPVSATFNDICPKGFYDKILYTNLKEFYDSEVLILDYLYDVDLSKNDLYWSGDCLNSSGREIFTKRVIKDLKDREYKK